MRPLASNETASGRAINRRIDVIVKPAPYVVQQFSEISGVKK